jgi:hypothetical protein
VAVSSNAPKQFDSWGVDNAEQLAAWTQNTMQGFRALGETLQAGMLNRIEARGPMQNVATASRGESDLCVGFYRSLPPDTMRQTMEQMLIKWVS